MPKKWRKDSIKSVRKKQGKHAVFFSRNKGLRKYALSPTLHRTATPTEQGVLSLFGFAQKYEAEKKKCAAKTQTPSGIRIYGCAFNQKLRVILANQPRCTHHVGHWKLFCIPRWRQRENPHRKSILSRKKHSLHL